MFEESKGSTGYSDADSQKLFDFKTKESQLRLGPISYLRPVSSFQLASDLKSCLDLYCEAIPCEFKMDFSLPANMLSPLVAPINKLKLLPDQIQFSEFFSFKSHSGSTKQLASEPQKDSDMYFIANIDPGVAEFKEVCGGDNKVAQQTVVQPTFSIFSSLLRRQSLFTPMMRNFFVDAERTRQKLSSQDYTKSILLTSYKQKLNLQSVPTRSKNTTSYSGLPFIFQEERVKRHIKRTVFLKDQSKRI